MAFIVVLGALDKCKGFRQLLSLFLGVKKIFWCVCLNVWPTMDLTCLGSDIRTHPYTQKWRVSKARSCSWGWRKSSFRKRIAQLKFYLDSFCFATAPLSGGVCILFFLLSSEAWHHLACLCNGNHAHGGGENQFYHKEVCHQLQHPKHEMKRNALFISVESFEAWGSKKSLGMNWYEPSRHKGCNCWCLRVIWKDVKPCYSSSCQNVSNWW